MLTAAIGVATQGNQTRFAVDVLGHTDASQVRAWDRAERPLPRWLRKLCRVILDHRSVARWMADA